MLVNSTIRLGNIVNIALPSQVLSTYVPPGSFQDGRNTMTRFASPSYTFVTPGTKYWLCLPDNRASNVSWYADSPDGGFYSATYGNGLLMYGTTKKAAEDFGFIVYTSNIIDPETQGQTVTPTTTPTTSTPTTTSTPGTTATPAASTPLPAGVTAGSGAAPVAPTASIKAPTEVTIADVPADEGGSLKLDWKASATADITGYKIFRSTTEVTKDFKEIVKTEKSVLTFTDNTAAIGQKYFYMVRAYKDSQESASSNVVNAVSVDNLAPAMPKNVIMKIDTENSIGFTWEANTEADLAGYLLSIISSDDDTTVIETIEIDKAAVTYSLVLADHPKVIAGTSYLYYLQAKDVNGNISERAIAADGIATDVAATSTPDTTETDDWALYASIALIVLLAAALTYLELKAKKDGKKLSPKVLYTLVGLIVITAGLITWRILPEGEKADSKGDTSKIETAAPKHADWSVFEGKKYPFKLYHPAEYTVTEGAGGNVSINKGADIIGEVYSVDNAGDDAGMLTASGNLYKDDSKGYMTGAVESTTTAAGVSAQRFTGTFGKNAGAKVMVHDGIKGSVVQFTKNGRTWEVFSFDNADPVAIKIFEDMIADLKF